VKDIRAQMTPLELRLLDEFQRDFPLVPAPYAAIASAIASTEGAVLGTLARLRGNGAISRIGAVFRPGAVGASTLAAMAVPAAQLERIAAQVSAHPEVSHNYEREHRLNLWFVATAYNARALDCVLARIATECGHPVLRMPLLEEYHIDLGFRLGREVEARRAAAAGRRPEPAVLNSEERQLAEALAGGLALVARPFDLLAKRAGLEERTVLGMVAGWQSAGIVRRFGVIVRHHELGYAANAMAVWDVDDACVAEAGARLARESRVTLAYRRERVPRAWPYNLYCMVHGREREEVASTVAGIAGRAGLAARPHALLFSRRRFKQTAARPKAREERHGWTPSIA
jgi:DNA-binding Lrp family transcriptional regulator